MKLLTFSEALKVAEGKKHLLLGNGFSQALKPDIFSYKALLEEADFSGVSEGARKAFDLFRTQDFEIIIRALTDAAKLMELYNKGLEKRAPDFNKDAEKLREILIDVIASRHPSLPSDIKESQYLHCCRFLSNFETFYTLNYDLLLYWALMHSDGKEKMKIDDGFRMPDDGPSDFVSWNVENTKSQRVFYLHGALHLFDAGTEIQKYTWINTGIPLLRQIRKAMDDGMFPLFVAEGKSEEKKTRINHSGYLNRGYRSFASIKGNLFVYGHSFAENDAHILKLIEQGRITSLFVSIYGDPESKGNKEIIKRAEAMEIYRKSVNESNQLKAFYYDADSANIWGNK